MFNNTIILQLSIVHLFFKNNVQLVEDVNIYPVPLQGHHTHGVGHHRSDGSLHELPSLMIVILQTFAVLFLKETCKEWVGFNTHQRF